MGNGSGQAPPIMEVAGLTRRYGGVVAVDDLSFSLAPREKLAVIGPNGAGKSTLLKLVAGQERPSSGRVRLDGAGDVTGGSARGMTKAGVALARQSPRPLASLTVRQNVEVGLPAGRARDPRHSRERLEEILDRTALTGLAERPAGSLALLDLKRLEVARALACVPRVLLLDEVSAGLNESDLDAAIELIAGINASGTALLIVEHVQRVVHELADRVIVLNWGRLLTEGTPAQVTADEEVRTLYLGAGRAPAATANDRRPRTAAVPGLSVDDVTVARGGLTVLRDVGITVGRGEIVALLGANGAGKTTLTQTISGLLRPAAGSLSWHGADITRLPVHRRSALGIAHCQEGRKLFAGLTVRENLVLGAFGASRAQIAERLDEVYAVFPVLAECAAQVATTLSGGQQQMAAIGRALMSAPELLLCDEVTLGLSPRVADEIYDALARTAARGTGLLLVEQDARRCLGAADRAYVLARGRVHWHGPADRLDDDVLVAAYLESDAAPPR